MTVSTPEWSEQALQTRIRRRAAELGIPVRDLLTAAGMAPDAFSHPPRTSRRIDTIEKLARAADWSLAEAMGFEEVSTAVLQMALEIMRRGLRDAKLPTEMEAEIVRTVYDLLTKRRREGQPIDPNVTSALEEMIYRTYVWGRSVRPLPRSRKQPG
jgi:hypothetical protein